MALRYAARLIRRVRNDLRRRRKPGLEKLLSLNAEFAKTWPNITAKKDPPADAKAWEDVPGKLEQHFSPDPGAGD